MNKLALTKKAVHLIVTVGTGKIVNDIVKYNTTPEGLADQVTYRAGSYALGGVVATQTADYTDRKIDEIAKLWSDIKRIL